MTETASAIAKASATARARLAVLDRATVERLLALYRDAADNLTAEIARYAGAGGNLRLEVMRELLAQITAVMGGLRVAQRTLLTQTLISAAELGAAVWVTGPSITLLAETAVRFVENFTAADGLKLSDRLWRLDNGALQAVTETLRRSVALGRDASRAAQDFLARGEAIPPEVRAMLGLDNADRLGKSVANVLTASPPSAYDNALRVFRTELNRAHGEAYQHGAGSNPDVIGMKFNLSPNHPRHDICCRKGTLIATINGAIPIESVTVGDLVLTHRGRWKEVVRLYRRELVAGSRMIRVTTQTESGRNHPVVLTPNHPVLTEQGWIPAGDLKTGCRAIAMSSVACTHPFVDDVSDKAPSNFPENSIAPGLRSIFSKRCDALLNGLANRTVRMLRLCFAMPTAWHKSDGGIFQRSRFPLSSLDSHSPAENEKDAVWFRASGETCLDGVSHNLDFVRLSLARIFESNIGFYGIQMQHKKPRTFGTSMRRSSGFPHNILSSNKPAFHRLADTVALKRFPRIQGTAFRSTLTDIVPRNACHRTVWLWFWHRAVEAKELIAIWIYKIHRFLQSRRTPHKESYINNSMFSSNVAEIDCCASNGETVFNLGVEDDHTYVANGLVVHNCDLHAKANLHGLGPGVYPVGATPWPAHPNTMSYLTAVFRDEVSDADRAGRKPALDWLSGLKPEQQEQILGAAKARALRAGVLNETDLLTPWKNLKDGYERRGYTFD